MACEGPIVQCTMNHPTVAAVGVAAGYVLAKAQQMRAKRNQGMGMGFQ